MQVRTILYRALTSAVLTIGLCPFAVNAVAATTGGIVPINQSKVPFTITASGSYKLTSDLVVTDPTVSAITVLVPNVTIDLNGFSIMGGFRGINALLEPLITVTNGQISGMAQEGVVTGHSSRIERIRAFGNGRAGISCDDGCEITNCVVNNNSQAGIEVINFSSLYGRALVASNVVQYNGSVGIFVANGASLITGNVVNHNGGYGLQCGGMAGYSNNVFFENGGTPYNCVNMGQNICTGTSCP